MKKQWVLVGAFLGWFAVLGQYGLIIANRVESVPETTLRFFTYFTILSNILVASFFLSHLVKPPQNDFFKTHGKSTAIAVYIFVVGLVYQTVLRFVWSPTGFQWVIDEMLHSVMPLLYLAYWAKFETRNPAQWKQIPKWLLFPVGYLVVILTRGSLSGFYPYPFVDAGKLPLPSLIINITVLIFVFVIAALGFVKLAQVLAKRK